MLQLLIAVFKTEWNIAAMRLSERVFFVEYGKFILMGEDKKTLSLIKNTLVSNGHIFIGYSKETGNTIRYIRNCSPDFIFLEVSGSLKDVRNSLEVIDDEILASVILVLNQRNDEAIDFLRNTRVITYITKPVYDEILLQIVDLSLANFKRIIEYEEKVKKLNNTIEGRKVVEKAKWILVEKSGLTENGAYEAIRKKSRDNRVTMREIAEAIILTRG